MKIRSISTAVCVNVMDQYLRTKRSCNNNVKTCKGRSRDEQKCESGVAEHVHDSVHFSNLNNSKIEYPWEIIVKRRIVESPLITTTDY